MIRRSTRNNMTAMNPQNSSYTIYDLETSYYQLWENRDLRVEDKFFVFSSYGLASPLIPCTIVACYLLLITWILPEFMKNREPFHMKGTLLVYNFIQVVLSCLCVYYMWVGGGHGSYCKLQDMENSQYIKICKIRI